MEFTRQRFAKWQIASFAVVAALAVWVNLPHHVRAGSETEDAVAARHAYSEKITKNYNDRFSLSAHFLPSNTTTDTGEGSAAPVEAVGTYGNFRLLARLLTQMLRVVEINQLNEFSIDVVETARENLVIGQA